MPRKNLSGTLQNERNIAERIADERQTRGLSQEGLAKLVTEAGCPLQGSAVYRIENGDPPRTISFNEAVAFAAVFDIGLEELSEPKALRNQAQARDIALELAEASRKLDEAHTAALEAAIRLVKIGEKSPQVWEFIAHHFTTASRDRENWLETFVGGPVSRATLGHLATVADQFWNEVVRLALGNLRVADD